MEEQAVGRQQALKDGIIKYVTEHWSTTRSAVLLSSLGQHLNRTGFNLKDELAGRKFADFISVELADKVVVIQSRQHQPWIAALPKDMLVSGDTDVEKYFKPTVRINPSAEKIPQLPPVLWAAFSRPPVLGRTRTLDLGSQIRFQDVDEGSTLGSETKKIERKYLNEGDRSAPGYNLLVFNNIKSWLDDNNLSLDEVLARTTAKESSQPSMPSRGASLMEQILAALTDDQLHRTQLPLDVVARLLKA